MAGHELLVRVEAVSIEGGDTLNRTGGEMSRVPHIVGYQCAGTVVAVGDQVTGLRTRGTGS
jgi:NADPH2:quinone reductase